MYSRLPTPDATATGSTSEPAKLLWQHTDPWTPFPSFVPNDPLHDAQWHLGSATAGIGIETIWDDYAGRGVLIGIIDDGFEYAHSELRGTYRADLDYDTVGRDGDAAPGSVFDNHGTAVAGVIGATTGNGYGGSGVAWAAGLVGYRISYGRVESTVEIQNALERIAAVDVVNNSWGYGGFFGDNFATETFAPHGQAIEDAVLHGRDGLGTVLVFAAGNGRAQGQDVNYHDFQNSPYVITVGATDRNGAIASFSTPGAAVLVAAPGDGILTTDRTGVAGYSPGDFASLSGTSFAAPIVSGVVALMLEANPALGYRDVQEILAYSAQKTSAFAAAARTNGAANWNGGGLTYNHDFGFGLVDARAAVRLAETWEKQSTFADAARLSASAAPNLAIPDLGTASHAIEVGGGADLEIDRVEVTVDIDHGWIGDLVLTLVSPSGTESVLVNRPGVSAASTYGIGATSLDFTMDSVHFWGERPEGTWTLRVQDAAGGCVGTLRSWRLDFIGDSAGADDLYVYTDAFASLGATTGRSLVRDTDGGTDTLNFAAIRSAVSVDLTPGAASGVLGRALTIDSETVIENAEGGDGGDWIAGNAAPNRLRGWRGDDSLAGAAGDDLLDGGDGTDTVFFVGKFSEYTVSATAGGYVIADKVADRDSTDTVRNVERLQFADHLLDLAPFFTVARSGATMQEQAQPYSGPVAHLRWQCLGTAQGEVVIASADNDFLNLLGGDDAAAGGAGDDVIDGGLGSNFLSGGAGRDVFFLDGRGAASGAVTWGTITDWQAGEQLSVWGWRPGVSRAIWADSDGAEGWKGVTMHADLDANGGFDTSITWRGLTRAQLPAPLEFDGLLWFT